VKFIDETIITVRSGDGGKGCVSFRREKHVPRGGPDGGDGGKGGDVVLKATNRKRTLYDFRFKREFKASSGSHGQGKQRTGKNGEDLIIHIPPGTLIIDAETGETLNDLVAPEQTFVVVHGGEGGRGNARFKTATNRAPRYAQPGRPGQMRSVKLELKLIADVGLVGLPNAGKSTLISAISSARPKIADYPFTTLTPNLGVVQTGSGEPFIVADIPGLIEGAHKGAGLGTRFLRHIERTRMLVHLIDASAIDDTRPMDAFETIDTELSRYGRNLAAKPRIIALNKVDLPGAAEAANAMLAALDPKNGLKISALTGKGLAQLKTRIVQMLDEPNENR